MEFKEYKYSEIGKIKSGKRLPKGYAVIEEKTNNKYIRVRDITNNSINYNEVQYITDEAAKKIEKYKVKAGDIIISVVGTVGAICEIPKELNDAYLTENCDKLLVNEDICLKKYLKYFLISKDGQAQVKSNTVGSNQPKLPIYGIENFDIKVPKIKKQKKILCILDNIDKKIELNNQINDNLYEIGKTLFENLFELENFENKNLNDVCNEITRGYTKNYVEKSNIINLNQKVNKGKILEKQYFKYLDEKQEIPANRFVKKNDILLNSLGQGTLGRVHLFLENVDNIVVDQHITIIRTDNNIINPYYLYYLLVSKKYQDKLVELVTGTTGMQMLNISAIRELKIPIPMKKNIDNFEKNVKLIFEKININNLENENLIKLRDTLLPKLMNGELDLDNIEI